MINIYNLILIPLILGLIGFLEPCSLGINVIFLNRINQLSRSKRLTEALLFTFVRGLFLALMGISAAFIGSRLITIQSSFFIILGVVYIIIGILMIINMYWPVFRYSINLSGLINNSGILTMGVVFGLVIPACAISFVIALIGKSLLMGDLLEGFISLFVFGIALSSPLIIISLFERSNEVIAGISQKARSIPYIAGAIMVLIGLFTTLSSSWWAGALKIVK